MNCAFNMSSCDWSDFSFSASASLHSRRCKQLCRLNLLTTCAR